MSAAIIKQVYPKAECVEMQYGYGEHEFLAYEQEKYDFVFVVDFSFTERIMKVLEQSAIKEFIWIDHHKTAMEKLPELWNSDAIGGLRDLTRSAAMLTWEWFFNPYELAPLSVQLVEDYDLWRFDLENTKEFAEAVQFWDVGDFVKVLGRDELSDIIDDGVSLLEQKMKRIEQLIKKSKQIYFDNHYSYIVNSTSDVSMVGNQILENKIGCEVAIICQLKFDETPKVIVSLRSKEGIDVSNIAKKYGGGGHPQAAGFEINLDDFQNLLK